MEKSEARELLHRYVKSDALIAHSLATAAIMREVARHLGEDAGLWETIGLLHDIDYEVTGGDMQRHGPAGYDILRAHGVSEEIAEIVRRHNHTLFTGHDTPVEIALQAADSVSGLIIACALVKGGKLSEVTPKTVRKKYKDKAFAAGCERERIRAIEPLMDMNTFYELAIAGLRGIGDELGLA
ncbi:MAG: HDIG domain-containing protein [Methanomicrobiaceae archaeon]|nr:HDIG domain-containing protein [Methanomicrobiaceae archaeon]